MADAIFLDHYVLLIKSAVRLQFDYYSVIQITAAFTATHLGEVWVVNHQRHNPPPC